MYNKLIYMLTYRFNTCVVEFEIFICSVARILSKKLPIDSHCTHASLVTKRPHDTERGRRVTVRVIMKAFYIKWMAARCLGCPTIICCWYGNDHFSFTTKWMSLHLAYNSFLCFRYIIMLRCSMKCFLTHSNGIMTYEFTNQDVQLQKCIVMRV